MPREGGLHLPSLAEHPAVAAAFGLLAEPLDHLPPVPSLGPLAAMPPGIQRDYGGPDPEAFAAIAVMTFTIERGVGQHPIPGDGQRGLGHDRAQLRGIVGRAGGHGGPGEEVAPRIAGDGQLGPQPGGVLASGSLEEVARGASALQSGPIDRRCRRIGDQAAVLCGRGGTQKEDDVGPPFSSRCSA